MKYTFKNKETGETLTVCAYNENEAKAIVYADMDKFDFDLVKVED